MVYIDKGTSWLLIIYLWVYFSHCRVIFNHQKKCWREEVACPRNVHACVIMTVADNMPRKYNQAISTHPGVVMVTQLHSIRLHLVVWLNTSFVRKQYLQPSNMMSADDTAQNKTSPSATTALMWVWPIAIAELLRQDVGYKERFHHIVFNYVDFCAQCSNQCFHKLHLIWICTGVDADKSV